MSAVINSEILKFCRDLFDESFALESHQQIDKPIATSLWLHVEIGSRQGLGSELPDLNDTLLALATHYFTSTLWTPHASEYRNLDLMKAEDPKNFLKARCRVRACWMRSWNPVTNGTPGNWGHVKNTLRFQNWTYWTSGCWVFIPHSVVNGAHSWMFMISTPPGSHAAFVLRPR